MPPLYYHKKIILYNRIVHNAQKRRFFGCGARGGLGGFVKSAKFGRIFAKKEKKVSKESKKYNISPKDFMKRVREKAKNTKGGGEGRRTRSECGGASARCGFLAGCGDVCRALAVELLRRSRRA